MKTITINETTLRQAIRKQLEEMVAYHGTGPDENFDQFDLGFVKQGTGQMTYGSGVYVSKLKDAAKQYAVLFGKNPNNLQILTVEIPDDDGSRRYIDWNKPLGGGRFLSEAELAATAVVHDVVEEMRKTDSDGVYQNIQNKQILRDFGLDNLHELTGEDFYNHLSMFFGNDDEKTSQFLASHGYYGIKIYDSKNQFYNYVVFDPRNVKIIDREKINR